jgi:hypothetical protein
MEVRWKRRLGAIAVIVLILTALVVPAASAGGTCPTGGGCRAYYRVRVGDTLTKIAYRYGTTVAALQQCNGIWNPDRIYAGQTLCICGGYKPCPPPKPQPKPCPPPRPQPLPPCPYPCQPVHPVPPPPSGPWQAWYWNNTDLSGDPVLQQNVASVNFNWGDGSPGPQVPVDNFSARYQRTQQIATGTYRVTTSSDDGVRVSIDNVLVIDDWNEHPVNTTSQDVIIMNGNHQITIEYVEYSGLAEIHFSLVKLY